MIYQIEGMEVRAALQYAAFTVARRMLERHPMLLAQWTRVWHLFMEKNGYKDQTRWGLIARMYRITEEIGLRWKTPVLFETEKGPNLSLVEGNKRFFLHGIREELRDARLRAVGNTYATRKETRKDMQGITRGGVDKAGTLLLRDRRGGEKLERRILTDRVNHVGPHREVVLRGAILRHAL